MNAMHAVLILAACGLLLLFLAGCEEGAVTECSGYYTEASCHADTACWWIDKTESTSTCEPAP